MSNKYMELKNRQQQEVNDFPMFFAFSDKQFEEGMKKLGLDPKDTDKIYRLDYTGGFYRRSDAKAFRDMIDRHAQEMDEAVANDPDGTGFIYDMFSYELANHEYCITYDLEPTLDACGLTCTDVANNLALKSGLQRAKDNYLANCF